MAGVADKGFEEKLGIATGVILGEHVDLWFKASEVSTTPPPGAAPRKPVAVPVPVR